MSEILWRPSADICQRARLTRYLEWLKETRALEFPDYDSLWQWSTSDLEAFWMSVWEYFDVASVGDIDRVLAEDSMPGATWFTGTTVNYAAQVFRHATPERPAIVYQGETTDLQEVSWAELEREVAALAAYLRSVGVQPGDRIVGYLPNAPEAVVAFLAAASVGAIWSLCAPDLGVQGVLDRFQQIQPKVLIAGDAYTYNGKFYDRAETIAALVDGLPELERIIVVKQGGGPTLIDVETESWTDIMAADHELDCLQVPFDHPLWVLYSSGTTGVPKAIVHGQGGVIVEHLKALHFHLDLGEDDRYLWYSSTAWMMWNYQVSGLLLGTTICIYDGNPAWPDMNRLWQFIEASEVTFFGAGAAFFDGCRNAGITPRAEFDLAALRAVGSTGSPLLPESYRWIYDAVGADVWLVPVSGGTDLVSAFVGGVPTLPVRIGEMACRCLGAAVAAFDDDGHAVVDEVGELVCTRPMPSMPLYFWNDDDNQRYLDSYYDVWPGTWRHGDWIRITKHGGAVIYGRSDATINRHGIRMGTSELYAAVEALPEVADSLVVDLEFLGRESYMPLFVVLSKGIGLHDELVARIRDTIKKNLSPRHVPNEIFEIDDVPRTFSGKKLEIPIRKLLLGQPADEVINRDTMSNPDSVVYFIRFAGRLEK